MHLQELEMEFVWFADDNSKESSIQHQEDNWKTLKMKMWNTNLEEHMMT